MSSYAHYMYRFLLKMGFSYSRSGSKVLLTYQASQTNVEDIRDYYVGEGKDDFCAFLERYVI